MAWTAPRTWIAGEVVSAALLNAHVRDNLLMLGNPGWAAYTPTLTNFVGTIIEARWMRLGNNVRVVGQINLTGVPTSSMFVSVPTAPRASAATNIVAGQVLATDTSAATTFGGVSYVDTINSRFAFQGFAGAGAGVDAGVGVPFTWASGDVLRFAGEYEV